jgi:hypothetical protein
VEFPLVATALATGEFVGVLPRIASTELQGADVLEIKSNLLKSLDRDFCVAWSPRTLAIRSFLPNLQRILAELCQLKESVQE